MLVPAAAAWTVGCGSVAWTAPLTADTAVAVGELAWGAVAVAPAALAGVALAGVALPDGTLADGTPAAEALAA